MAKEHNALRWTGKTISAALDQTVPASLAEVSVQGFSIDSRTLVPGQCFIAIRGPHFDGHDFVEEAVARGAALCLVTKEYAAACATSIGEKLIAVDDTLEALHALARFARRRWGRPVIGVTGSVGKTTTKDMIAALLSARYRVLKSVGNLNNEYGLPLSLLRLKALDELAVLEMGMTHKGEIARLCAIAEPTLGVVTNVEAVHLAFFSSLEEIALAKRELIEGLPAAGTAVLNADDKRVVHFAEGFPGTVIRFGLDPSATLRAEAIQSSGLFGSEFTLVVGDQRERITLPLPGEQHIANALAACAVAFSQGIALAQMREVLANFQPVSLRGETIRFGPEITVINDTYNSNPAALAAMAHALGQTPGVKRRVLVAGEMKELGDSSALLHELAGRQIAVAGNIGYLVGVMGQAQYLVQGALQAGFPADKAHFFATKDAAADWLCRLVQPGDCVLLKASRGVALETVLDVLRDRLAAPADVRQEEGQRAE